MKIVEVVEGEGPVVLGQPHGGTEVPEEIRARLNAVGAGLSDTDWHIGRLYDGLLPGATVVQARLHRYVIDCNRDPSGASLYPGQATTGLCPVTDFDGRPLWSAGAEPDEAEIARRRDAYHAPYHAALAAQIERVRARHGVCLFFDCHSIRSLVPRLFEGRLPTFNLGTNGGASCAPAVESAVRDAVAALAEGPGDWVLNGRFKGGWCTRHYGRPEQGLHAVQLELAQRAYMEEVAPWRYDPARAEVTRGKLKQVLEAFAGSLA
ncbi:formiminoglutamase [Tistlia consotensis]|uniref:Formiminoglutamase n=1 Tax=Tistlia consotensis USBA 355 TaxID=560819 RepID=A0A1Y6BF02_9PROT|nr:N-formylglutamate deformylase [Tistlia consotensis]SMF07893.1 formiminoglutamase [Tistlia consotensis USBA 355]SNR35656.1 formiminoglutamase [Tistlia consotensis]